jgi:hypothetical protein
VRFLRLAALSVVFLATIAGLSYLAANNTSAQQNSQDTGSGLQVSPTRTEISGQPGETKNFSITIKNITQANLVAQVFLNDFQSDNNSGTPQIIVDSNQRTPYTLVNMLKGYTSVDLAPGQTKEIKLTVTIPNNVAPGAYFGALRYAAVPKEQADNQDERQVSLTASVAHLVFVEVPGDVNEQIQIESLKAQRSSKPGTFFLKSPNQVAVSVKNLGNGFSRPFGKVTVNGVFGKTVESFDINNTDPRGIILPDSARSFSNNIKNLKIPGKYTLTASVAYGDGGEVVSYKSSFIYLPIWAIVILALLLIAVAGGGYYFYRKRFGKKSQIRRR